MKVSFDDNYQSWGGDFSFTGLVPSCRISVGLHQAAGRFLKSKDDNTERRVWNTWYVGISGLDKN